MISCILIAVTYSNGCQECCIDVNRKTTQEKTRPRCRKFCRELGCLRIVITTGTHDPTGLAIDFDSCEPFDKLIRHSGQFLHLKLKDDAQSALHLGLLSTSVHILLTERERI